MASDLSTEASITIRASAFEVWDAITTPALIERWFFGVRTESDWRVGASIVHRGEYQGQAYEDRGTIHEFEPPHRLMHTHWSPLSGLPDRPEHHQVVTWELDEHEGMTTLTVSETNLPSEAAKATSEAAWPAALEALRGVVEG